MALAQDIYLPEPFVGHNLLAHGHKLKVMDENVLHMNTRIHKGVVVSVVHLDKQPIMLEFIKLGVLKPMSKIWIQLSMILGSF